ncbi:hypothetical protein N5I87_03865 [Ralstonia sp. CHL-2022]|uniref:Uncharacterized protein n=1 Tax=Ralstonia mojiangensis TaxID=2953895 RepID=A0AAE3I1T6_9RALS|nr:hypothetical protein [Ralstonia mojiangensis]MCT7315128.1 hypothetical protein [Ralstonia mojiangensis]
MIENDEWKHVSHRVYVGIFSFWRWREVLDSVVAEAGARAEIGMHGIRTLIPNFSKPAALSY